MPSFMIVRLQTSEIKRGQTNRQTDRQTNRQCDLYIYRYSLSFFLVWLRKILQNCCEIKKQRQELKRALENSLFRQADSIDPLISPLSSYLVSSSTTTTLVLIELFITFLSLKGILRKLKC